MSEQSIVVPDLGVDGPVEVIEISVAVGDEIKVDDVIAVMESDKATVEVPASHAGQIGALHIKVGDKVSQGDILLSLITNEAEALSKQKKEENPTTENESPEQKTDFPATSIIPVLVPDIGTENGQVIEVVKNGQEVEAEAVIVVLESDKASMEIPAPQAGIVRNVSVKLGDTLKEGDKVIDLEVKAREDAGSVAEQAVINDMPRETVREAPEIGEGIKQVEVVSIEAGGRSSIHAGPAVRKMAREFGIDLTEVTGSGPKGRILKEDLMDYTKQRLSNATPSAQPSIPSSFPEIDFSRFGEIEKISRSRIQKVSAMNLTRSWSSIPQVTQFDEADITDLEAFRRAQSDAAKAEGYKLTLLAFLVKAAVATLKKYPDFNSSLDNSGEYLVRKQYFHIGIAVETADGLVVPVVRNADNKGVKEIAIELISLAEKAREKKLKPAEMQGASFTISSLGGLGGTKFTPIVNWPEVAILGVSKSQLRPTYIHNELHPRLWLPLSLSYDHRVIDGAAAARFTNTLSELLSDIRHLIL